MRILKSSLPGSIKTVILIIGFAWGFPVLLLAQTTTQPITFLSDEYVLDHWTIQDGLPVNAIRQVFQSSDGYIWVITYDGIARFDGVSFTLFDTNTNPELPRDRFRRIYETRDGRLWFLTEEPQALFSLEGSRFRQWGTDTGLAGNQVLAFHTGPDGTVWIGTESGISTYRDGVVQPFHPSQIAGAVDNIFADSDSTLFYRHNSILDRFDGDEHTTLLKEAQPRWPYHAFARLQSGGTVLSAGPDLFRYSNGRMDLLADLEGEPNNIFDIDESENGEIVFSTSGNGFWRINGDGDLENIHPYAEGVVGMASDQTFLSGEENRWKASSQTLFRGDDIILHMSDLITGYLHDRENGIWVSTYSSGLFRLKQSSFKTISIPEGLSGRNIYPVTETADGDFLAGTMFDGLNKIEKSGRITHIETESQVRSIFERKNGTVLIGQNRDFVYQLAGEKVVPWHPDPEPIPNAVHAIFENQNEQVFAGANNGLFLYTENSWKNLTKELNLSKAPVRYFAPAPDSTLWMATAGGGVFGLSPLPQGPRGERFGVKGDSLTVKQLDIPADFIRSIFVDNSSSDPEALEPPDENGYDLWIGTENQGLFRIRWYSKTGQATQACHLRKENGLPDNTIHQILDDGRGNFWMSTNAGIFTTGISHLHEWCDDENASLNIITFTERDGMRNREANGGIQPAGLVSRDGQIWFSTQDGIVRFDPEQIHGNTMPPPVEIEHIQANNVYKVFPDDISLGARQRNFEIKYAGLSYEVPEKVTFSYKLEGFDEDWLNAETRRTAYYTNVPPGDYQFKVMAFNNDGVPSNKAAVAAISVRPFFYETGWFRLIAVSGFLLTIFGVVRLRIRNFKKSEALLRKTVERRTAELKEAKEISEEQARRLRETDEMKSRFFANMSHEFRTPLALILGPLDELVKLESRNIVHEKLLFIQRNGFRLQRLVDQVLDLVKLEAGGLQPELQWIDIGEFAQGVTAMFRLTAEQQGIVLTVSGEAVDTQILADSEKLEHIIVNLLSNAIKFTDAGGTVDVQVKDDAGHVYISVSDSGQGIPDSELERIFDRFYQVSDGDNHPAEGMGIGLALCKELMLLHKGKIWAESKQGAGSSFHLKFLKGDAHFSDVDVEITENTEPGAHQAAVKESAAEAITMNSETETNENSPDTNDYDQTTVLVVDDYRDMRTYISSLLRDKYRIVEASDGEKALKKIRKLPPDIIIADIMMPVMDGFTFSRMLRNDPLHRNIPILFLSARADETDEITGLQQGGDDYLSKPFKTEILRARVSALLASQQRTRDNILSERTKKSSVPTSGNWLSRLALHIDQHLDDSAFGVDRLAELMHMDRTRLYRKSKKLTGHSPIQLLKEARLTKAQKLIEAGETNYSGIAYACGFNSLSYFSRSYRTFFGHTPSSYPPGGDAQKEMKNE